MFQFVTPSRQLFYQTRCRQWPTVASFAIATVAVDNAKGRRYGALDTKSALTGPDQHPSQGNRQGSKEQRAVHSGKREQEHAAKGKHYEAPDTNSSEYEISYTLSSIRLEEFPVELSNFRKARDFYERAVLDGNREQKDVYVDENAFQLFEAVFPEIVRSRGIGMIARHHFDIWDYRNEPDRVLLEKAFRIIDRDGSGTIEKGELYDVLQRIGLAWNNDLFGAIDKDGSGEIDLGEFQEFWKASSKFDGGDGKEALRLLGDALQENVANIAKPLVENNVEVIYQHEELKVDEHADFLAVGGPSAYTSALLYKAQYPDKSLLHVVGNRFDSNADGSAYYYHERDAFPLYVNKVNTGWYCVYADLNKRFRSGESLRDLCVNDRHHVKIAIQWRNLLQNPWMIFSIFIPNTYHEFMDLAVRKPKDSLMAQACLHSQRVPRIVDNVCRAFGLPTRAFLIRDPDRAVYVDVEGRKRAGEHFDWLNNYADIPYHSLDPSAFGSLVTEALAFNRDGALNPWMFENFHRAFDKVGIDSRKGWFLDCLYVTRDEKESHRIVGNAAQFANCATGEQRTISFDRMVFSLGPSGAVIVDPVLSENLPQSSTLRTTLNSVRRVIGRGTMAHKGTMWAAGSSSVCVIGIKRGKAAGEKLDIFRKFIDGVNQHWTLMKEREVSVGEDTFDFFVMQMTGGGNFPSRQTKPDFVLNLLYTTEAVFGLDAFESGDVMYDIVQSRGCGRSVSARNTVGFNPIAKNVVSAYGLGGIGMTTAFANGALQLQILESLEVAGGDKSLVEGSSEGKIGNEASQIKLKEVYGDNIFAGVNYNAMIDDPQKVARGLGIDQSITGYEKSVVVGVAAAGVIGGLALF